MNAHYVDDPIIDAVSTPTHTRRPPMHHCTDLLTHAELLVLQMVDSGLSNQEIAQARAITLGTVKCHLHRVYDKLQARNRVEALVKARASGEILASGPARTHAQT